MINSLFLETDLVGQFHFPVILIIDMPSTHQQMSRCTMTTGLSARYLPSSLLVCVCQTKPLLATGSIQRLAAPGNHDVLNPMFHATSNALEQLKQKKVATACTHASILQFTARQDRFNSCSVDAGFADTHHTLNR
ncbi:MAG: hypothetical protein ACH253_02115 [Candidatus Thiodiazotropha sp.]